MKAYVFPGQGAQFVGMGKDLYTNSYARIIRTRNHPQKKIRRLA